MRRAPQESPRHVSRLVALSSLRQHASIPSTRAAACITVVVVVPATRSQRTRSASAFPGTRGRTHQRIGARSRSSCSHRRIRPGSRTFGRRYEQRRQLIVDRLTACREAEARAAREYKATIQRTGAVRQRLASEWEASDCRGGSGAVTTWQLSIVKNQC